MKHIRFIMGFAAVMLFFANNIWAYDFQSGVIYYNITSNSSPYTVEVTYRTTSYNSYSGSITIPDSVTYNGITYSVTSIGNSAFKNCTGLTSITIPNSVTTIGYDVFYQDTSLTSVTIPNSVKSIGQDAFWGCTGLTRTNFTGTISQWCNIDFHGVVANPVSYSCNLYINNQLVTNLVIPNTVDTIKQYAFYGDTCITSVTIGNSVTSIGNSAFYRCTGLTSVTIGNSVTSIGNHAFYDCTGLTSVTIGNSVTSIGNNAFSNCTGLTSVAIPNSVTSIGNAAFYGCRGLTSITIPNSVTSIGNSAFYSCSGLTSITFRRANTTIGNNNFNGLPVGLPIHIPCGSSAWYINKLPNFSNFIEELQYSYSVTSQDTVKGTVATVTAPTCNTPSWTISATANTGYTFSHWSDGNTQNPRTLTVTQDTVLVACFTSSSQQWYNFNVVSEDVNKGTVQVLAQPSQSNPQATFVALPNTGYTFSRWSDGNTQNPRSITVTQDTILIAFFTSTQGIAEAENASIKLYPNPASDKVTLEGIGNEADIFIINAMGKVVRRYENVGGTVTFSVGDLPKGIYFVRVGNAARKLVID